MSRLHTAIDNKHISFTTVSSSSILLLFSRQDLTLLANIAGTIVGARNSRVFGSPRDLGTREIVSYKKALERYHIESLPLLQKESLGVMNGTASVASLALHDAVHLALLAQVCTAMATEVLLGVRANYYPFHSQGRAPTPWSCAIAER